MKMFEDLEKEFGGPPPGRKRDSKFVPNSLPFMPVYHPLIIDTVGKWAWFTSHTYILSVFSNH